MSRVELFEQIRRDERDETLSIRALAEQHRVHRRTVRQALESAVPPPRKTPERDSPQLGPHIATIRGWLEADLDAPVKQRHTARRVWQRLVDEHDATVAESTVRALVAEVKRELGLSGPEAMVPQSKPPGWEAEVDFGELKITLDGLADQRVWMFVMRLPSSGRTFRRVYGNETIESFLDGHVRAFEFFGGVPVLNECQRSVRRGGASAPELLPRTTPHEFAPDHPALGGHLVVMKSKNPRIRGFC